MDEWIKECVSKYLFLMWKQITHPYPNFKCGLAIKAWMRNYIAQINMDAMTVLCYWLNVT